ncbi:MAG: ABC transporter ATP-binding protein [Acidimicrobiia bacterium]
MSQQEERKPRVPLRKLIGVTSNAIRLVWQSSRRETIAVFILQVLMGLILPAQVITGKFALEAILGAARAGLPVTNAMPEMGLFFGVFVSGRFLSAVARERQRLLSELVSRNMHERLAEKAVSLDLFYFETPSFYDRLIRAQRESYRPLMMVMNLTSLLSTGVAVVGLLGILIRLEPLFAAVIVAAYVPMWLANVRSSRAMYGFVWRRTPEERQMNYISSILTAQHSAKEIRVFGLGRYLLNRYRGLFEDRLSELRKVLRKALIRNLLAAIGSAVLTAGGFLLVLGFYQSGRLSIADAGATLAALLLAGTRLSGVLATVGTLYESALFVDDYWSFLEIEPLQIVPVDAKTVPRDFSSITLDNVTFTYPETDQPALRGITMELRRGETIALVGENGAGKTTLAKLLCRLYDPESGTIAWDGIDIRRFDPAELRRNIAAIFQDFARYLLTARENIGFGDIGRIDDIDKVVEASRHAGADEFLSTLPQGYESTLGKLFDQGHELSIGQWQRVALARAFFREAPLVIMDEPTASLDARREYALFQTMRSLFHDRTVVLISHRFSSVRMADKIFVLREGEITERGSHEELIELDGLYAELFRLQASAYLGPTGASERSS